MVVAAFCSTCAVRMGTDHSVPIDELHLTETWVRSTINLLLDRSCTFAVSTLAEGRTITFVVTVPAKDLGKIVGRGGRIARELRAMLSTFAGKQKVQYQLDIRDAQ